MDIQTGLDRVHMVDRRPQNVRAALCFGIHIKYSRQHCLARIRAEGELWGLTAWWVTVITEVGGRDSTR